MAGLTSAFRPGFDPGLPRSGQAPDARELGPGEQHFKPGILLTDTDIHEENIYFVNHKQLKKGLSRLIENDALSYGCALMS